MRFRFYFYILLGLVCLPGCGNPATEVSAHPVEAGSALPTVVEEVPGWTNLFDGNSLHGWKTTNFGGEGNVSVSDGRIVMQWGTMLTGITYQGDFPILNYEISLEAEKLVGNDFFCGLTFPFKSTHATLILGGWGGTVTGISSIMDMDASGNETTTVRKYEKNHWYQVRLRVTEDRIKVWIDGEEVVDLVPDEKTLDIRPEVSPSRPLGIAAYQTSAALRNIRYRKLEGSSPVAGSE